MLSNKSFVWSSIMLIMVFSLSMCSKSPSVDDTGIGLNAASSECGGFNADVSRLHLETEELECLDQTLEWTYNETTQTVHFDLTNTWLNCCGERGIAIHYDDSQSSYEIAITDSPERMGRCSCMCFYDFSIDIPDVATSTLDYTLTQFITDSDTAKTELYQGQLELTANPEPIIVQEDLGYCSK